MHPFTDDGPQRPFPPGLSGFPAGLGWLAAAAGIAGASTLVLLTGLSDLELALGLPPWAAHLLSGTAGLAGAAAAWRGTSRRFPSPGLTPAQALSQLRRDLDLASAASPNPRGPGSSRDPGGLR